MADLIVNVMSLLGSVSVVLHSTEFPRVFAYTAHNIVESYKHQYCSITCITRGHPKPAIYWTKNGRLLNLNNNWRWNSATGQLAVPCYTRQDTAIYRCVATRTGLGTDSKMIAITVVESGKCLCFVFMLLIMMSRIQVESIIFK